MESDQVRITSTDGSDVPFVSRLEEAWSVGMVADITLTDGAECSAALIAMSSTTLILDHWDRSKHGPAGDPFTLELRLVAEVVFLKSLMPKNRFSDPEVAYRCGHQTPPLCPAPVRHFGATRFTPLARPPVLGEDQSDHHS